MTAKTNNTAIPPLLDEDSVEIDLSNISPYTYTTTGIPSGNYVINTSQFNGTSAGYTFGPSITSTDASRSLVVQGDANFEGDITWKGRSLGSLLETIEKRLAILQPDPEKLEHFEALQKAYEHYKTLEALCQIPKKDKE